MSRVLEIVVHARNTGLSEGDRAEAEQRFSHAARVFDQAVDQIDVEIAEAANPRQSDDRFRVEVTAAVAGRVVRIEASAGSITSALDDASQRLTRQLRRLKERLIDRNRRVEESIPDERPDETEEIVRVKQFVMKPMTIEEAVLQMDMLGHSFFFFYNADTDRHSVLYERRDGRLGLIEPS